MRQVLDRPYMPLLRRLLDVPDAHIFDHPLAQRRCPVLFHGSLLFDDSEGSIVKQVNQIAKCAGRKSAHIRRNKRHCRASGLVHPRRSQLVDAELLSNLAFEVCGSCSDLVVLCGFNFVFKFDACDDRGDKSYS